ncbi:MAG: serine hydrolase domain-containing protein [Bacteroidia bacterium]|nr:serine hydrolase domain-containing protein [Bacteroidia bacterium]
MKKLCSQSLILALLLIHSSLAFGQKNTEVLIDSLESFIQEKLIPGAMISIVKSDSLIFVGGIGYADIEKNEKVSAQHLFRQASISKSFTALGLFQLLKDSPYKLNSPIREIDPEIPFTNPWQADAPVRVSHLLEHTSGFEDFHLHAIYNKKDSTLPPIRNMLEDHRKSLHARWQAGTKKAYANPNYILAGHLIEKIAGGSFDQYIKENILHPIGMNLSGFYFKKPEDKLFAQGYQRIGISLSPIEFTTINGGPAGDFCTNASDMAAYLQYMLRRDTSIFTRAELERIENPRTSIAAKHGLSVGYGLGNYSLWKNGFLFHGHGGQIEGFTSRYVYSKEADIGVAVAINRNGNANELIDEILRHLLGNQNHAPKGRLTYAIPDSIKNKFSGFYEFNSPKSELIGFTDKMLAGLILDFQKEKLITRTLLGKAKDTLYYAGNNQFYVNNEGVPSAILIETDSEEAVFWINDHYTEKKSRLKRLLIFFGLLFSFLFLAAFTIYALVWFIRNAFKKDKAYPFNHLALLGVAVFFSLTFVGFGGSVSDPKSFTGLSFSSLLMYVSSYALIAMTLFSIYRCFKLPKKRGFQLFYVATSFGALAISMYLWDIGIIGLKLWSY